MNTYYDMFVVLRSLRNNTHIESFIKIGIWKN